MRHLDQDSDRSFGQSLDLQSETINTGQDYGGDTSKETKGDGKGRGFRPLAALSTVGWNIGDKREKGDNW